MTTTIERDYSELGNLSRAEANMEVVRTAYRCLRAGDWEGFFAPFTEDMCAYDAEGLPYGGVYQGKEGFRVLSKLVFESFEHVGWRLMEMTAGGDLVFVHIMMTFTPRGGEPFDHAIVELWRFRDDGRPIELRPYYYDTKLVAEKLARR